MRKPKRGDQIELQIERLSTGGSGVGRHDSFVVFVDHTAPQEKILAEVIEVKPRFARARLLRVLQPSPFRVEPPCPVTAECGGCPWQHVEYTEQLRQKQALVQNALQKFSPYDPKLVADVIPSPRVFRYRNRIQLHTQNQKVGFFKKGSHQLVDIQDCWIADEQLTQQIPDLRQSSGPDLQRHELRLNNPLGFGQVNSGQNQNLIAYVVKLAQSYPQLIHVLDLYAGAGNFSFPLAQLPGKKLDAVELHAGSVAHAKKQIAENKSATRLSPLSFHEQDVATYLQSCRPLPNSLVVLDPPRAGCGVEIMEQLRCLQAPVLVYVSCHPVTLARDLKALHPDYCLQSVQPFDMFPHTDHVEIVAVLTNSTLV